MNLDAKTQARQCVLCSRDCSGVPRVRDRSGRYYCRTCYERASLALEMSQLSDTQQSRSKSRRTRHRRNGEVARVDAGAVAATTRTAASHTQRGETLATTTCPSCSHVLAGDAVLCTNCGYDSRTGRKADSAVITIDAATTEELPGIADSQARMMHGLFIAGGLVLLAALSFVVALLAAL